MIDSLPQRIQRKIWPEPMSGCWLWSGSTMWSGYGRVCIGRKNAYVHRVVWVEVHGPIPDGLQVLHRCDNPPCCNPDHLFLGTSADNVADKLAKGRDRSGRPLTESTVLDIRAAYGTGRTTQLALARYYDVHMGTISRIVLRKSWRHLPEAAAEQPGQPTHRMEDS